ncbi:hypothetical protein KRP22_004569 [Phytophthora ramorum]|nr:hypothetical protein KRP22_14252 [Phytophthora ramorum]
MDVQPFYASLVAELGAEGASSFVPTLARLVPDDDRRKELVEFNAQQRTAFSSGNSGSSSSSEGRQSAFANRNSSMADSFRSDSVASNNGTQTTTPVSDVRTFRLQLVLACSAAGAPGETD